MAQAECDGHRVPLCRVPRPCLTSRHSELVAEVALPATERHHNGEAAVLYLTHDRAYADLSSDRPHGAADEQSGEPATRFSAAHRAAPRRQCMTSPEGALQHNSRGPAPILTGIRSCCYRAAAVHACRVQHDRDTRRRPRISYIFLSLCRGRSHRGVGLCASCASTPYTESRAPATASPAY